MEFLLGRPPDTWVVVTPGSVRAASGVVYTLHAVPATVVSRPARLLVLRGEGGFVTEGYASASGSSGSSESGSAAMPVLAYRVEGSLVLHVPCGAHDAPGVWTFLAPDMRYVGATFALAPRWPAASTSP
jgi:hypothetical protein